MTSIAFKLKYCNKESEIRGVGGKGLMPKISGICFHFGVWEYAEFDSDIYHAGQVEVQPLPERRERCEIGKMVLISVQTIVFEMNSHALPMPVSHVIRV